MREFSDLLNDYEVEHEDVVMKLFMHSLIEDARDWLRRFPNDSITSWSDLEKCFKEKYGDHTNDIFILNEFNNIKKGKNKSTFDFNVRFQKGMYKLFQVMKMEEMYVLLHIPMLLTIRWLIFLGIRIQRL